MKTEFCVFFFRMQSCVSTPEYCTNKTGNGSNDTLITRERFDCIFDQLSPALRDKRWQGK